jgi:predicted SnoaL-like aldol condensation-catalyzing enzyme
MTIKRKLLGTTNSAKKDTKTLVREYFHRLLNEKDLTVCDEMLSSEYIDHDAPADTPPGPGSIKLFVAGFLSEYPDLRVEIGNILAEGSQVAARLIWYGHHKETGEVFHQMGIIMLRLNREGEFTERWSAYKNLI